MEGMFGPKGKGEKEAKELAFVKPTASWKWRRYNTRRDQNRGVEEEEDGKAHGTKKPQQEEET